MIHDLAFTCQYFVNLHTFSHVSLQVIFLDMIDMKKIDNIPSNMPKLNDENFPWVQNILDVHLSWINGLEGKWDTLPVSADLHTFAFFAFIVAYEKC
jgi:hypothetical protein